jgi:hypothetical protein
MRIVITGVDVGQTAGPSTSLRFGRDDKVNGDGITLTIAVP